MKLVNVMQYYRLHGSTKSITCKIYGAFGTREMSANCLALISRVKRLNAARKTKLTNYHFLPSYVRYRERISNRVTQLR